MLLERDTARSGTAVAALHDVRKRFGEVHALRGVDLAVGEGEVLALLGPNGAGKTTALSILVGLRRPDAGRASLFGGDPRRPDTRRRLGMTPQDTGLPMRLRVRETLELVAAHYDDPVPVDACLERFGLAAIAGRQTGGLSGGQRRRVGVALAFIGRPTLAVLDEPTTGLDVEARLEIWAGIRAHVADGGSVLLTTHDMHEADALASRVSVMHEGRVVAEGTSDDIKARMGMARVRLSADTVPELRAVDRLERDGTRFVLYTHDPDELVRELVRTGVAFADLQVEASSLEEIFLAVTGGGA